VIELEQLGVEGMAIELEDHAILVGELPVGAAAEELIVRAVELIPHEGQAERREVQANLVLPPGDERASHECILATALLDLHAGDRLLRAGLLGARR
jgi:hypothetical protein